FFSGRRRHTSFSRDWSSDASSSDLVVVMYALTNPQHTPWQVPHPVLYFDVPPGLESRNVLVRLGARHAFPEPAGLPAPGQVGAAIVELLEEEEVTLTMNNASLPVSSHAAGFDGVAP